MSRLEARLEAIRKAFAAKAPPEAKALMARATEELARSGQAERALGEGGQLPPFSLPDAAGEIHTSAEFLSRGPLVLTFFRGHW
jgi:hypothetical protein